jgi:4'-phosphopantetheinyl transferase
MPADLDWLTPGEAARLSGMRFTKRRNEYLLRRWAGKLAVAAVAGRTPEAGSLRRIALLNRPTGAPVAWLDGRPLGLEVSLTDRAGWAVCLVGDRASGLGAYEGGDLPGDNGGGLPGDNGGPVAVGVDLEIVEPRSPGFVRDYLTPAEQRYVGEQPDDDARHAAANLVWSAKESALKVLQTGLRSDTRSVEVEIDHEPDGEGWSPLRVRGIDGQALAGRVLPGWWRRDGVFLLTIAGDRPTPPPDRLPGGGDLGVAVPGHSWLSDPVLRR